MNNIVALFGESEKGLFNTAYYCQTLSELVDHLGNPPPNSIGLHLAVQSLLFHYSLLFIRVHEEGYQHQDYLTGLNLLKDQKLFDHISALCLPGVGDNEILSAAVPLCRLHHSVLIIREPDLYDYLTY